MYNELFMKEAINEAKIAFKMGEVPIGCVIVKNNIIIAKGHNLKESLMSVTRHAELIAVENASSYLNNWRLDGCDLYVTLEPCPMCASAIKQARINNVFCGLTSFDNVSHETIISIFSNRFGNHLVNFSCGYLSSDCKELVDNFFKLKR